MSDETIFKRIDGGLCVYGNGCRRILIRKVSWWSCHFSNYRFWIKVPDTRVTRAPWHRYWFWNIQLLLIGFSKCNFQIKLRFLNIELELGW